MPTWQQHLMMLKTIDSYSHDYAKENYIKIYVEKSKYGDYPAIRNSWTCCGQGFVLLLPIIPIQIIGGSQYTIVFSK